MMPARLPERRESSAAAEIGEEMKKIRLDQLVFDLGYTESRERAKTTIMSGLVFVNGQRADKPGMPVSPDVKLEVRGDALPFVSRGGLSWTRRSRYSP